MFIPIYLLYFFPLIMADLTLNYCSNTNVATGYQSTYSQFMSNGLCRDTCVGQNYAVAIVQSYLCWCTNTIPSSQAPLSQCDIPCPGTGSDNCAGNGYFGYLVVGNPNSIVSQSSSTSTTSTSSSSTTSTTSTTSTSSTSSTSTTSTTSTSSTSSTSSIPPTTSTSSSSTIAPTTSSSSSSSVLPTTTSLTRPVSTAVVTSIFAVTSVVISTQTFGQNKTTLITVASSQTTSSTITSTRAESSASPSSSVDPSPAVASPSSSNSAAAGVSHKSSFFDSPGKVAGTFTAVGIVVVAIVGGILYCCCVGAACFGRREDHDRFTDEETSINSIADEKALAGVPAGTVVEHSPIPPTYTRSTNEEHSLGTITPIKRNSSSKSIFNIFNPNSDNGVSRSISKKKLTSPTKPTNEVDEIMFPINETDMRLNPNLMFLNHNFSNKSLDDDQDYSRKLRVANP